MSGLEILGAVAGAGQLVDTGLAIVKFLSVLCSKLHDAPSSIKKRTIQIQHLVEVARLIQQSPLLQTALISSLLMNCIEKTNELRGILEKATAKLDVGRLERYWKSLGGVINESKISELCRSLEEEKSALVLCIASIDSDMLQSIDNRLVVIREGVDEVLEELPSIRETAQGVTALLSELALLKGMTANLRTELSSVVEKVTEIANLDKASQSSKTPAERQLHEPQTTRIQSVLPALRKALERLTLKDIPDMDYEMEMKDNAVDPAEELYSKERAIECFASLGATDQTRFLAERLSQNKFACRWFLETPKVNSWFSTHNMNAELLYITARAGWGKTTIIAHLIQHIKSTLKGLPTSEAAEHNSTPSDRSILLYFFFLKRSLDEEGTAVAAMKAMVTQLLHQAPNLYPVFLRQYEILSSKGSFSWSLDQLWFIFNSILERIPAKTIIYMVFDGLDECEEQSRRSLLSKLQGLVTSLQFQAPGNRAHMLKVMISGRPNEQVVDILTSVQQLEITIKDTAMDMNTLINSRVSQFALRRSLDRPTAQKLHTFLSYKAEGMFLWVVLVMEELDRRDERLSDEVITAKLQKVPMTLFSTYESILKMAPGSRQGDLWRILRWILYAKRVLSVSELEAALCSELEISRWHDFRGDLNFLCGSILRFENGAVSFVHQTLRDFLYDYVSRWPRGSTGDVDMGIYETETSHAITCMKFLEGTSHLKDFDLLLTLGRLRSNEEIDSWLRARPFLAYAAEFWCAHLHLVDYLASQTRPALPYVVRLFSTSLNRDMLMRLNYYFRYSKHPQNCHLGSNLHLAGYFKLPLLVEYYLSRGKSTEEDAGGGSHPLVWACETGDYGCVRKLLEANANPNQLEYDGWSPLHWAATNGHSKVCGLLISYGAKTGVEDDRGYNPRDMAVQMGHYELAEEYFGGVEGAKVWKPSVISPTISIIGRRRVAA